MFSSNHKRTAATLGVLAGLLAVAGPATASGGGGDSTKFVVDGPFTAKAEPRSTQLGGANDVSALSVTADAGSGDDKVKAASGTQAIAAAGRQVMTIDPNNLDRVFQIRGDAQDTQTSRTSSLQNTMISGYTVTDPSSEADNS